MWEKIKAIKVNFCLLVFIAYAIKLIFLAPGYPDALVMAILGATYGYKSYLKLMEPRESTDLQIKKDVAEIKSALSKVNLGQIVGQPKKYF